ncbi:hypothetical protein FQA39_LY19418 [Lamprigera yunnana]|nr:hypothetical protein FQA39_LY19418 [Lamprigera yunnana]
MWPSSPARAPTAASPKNPGTRRALEAWDGPDRGDSRAGTLDGARLKIGDLRSTWGAAAARIAEGVAQLRRSFARFGCTWSRAGHEGAASEDRGGPATPDGTGSSVPTSFDNRADLPRHSSAVREPATAPAGRLPFERLGTADLGSARAHRRDVRDLGIFWRPIAIAEDARGHGANRASDVGEAEGRERHDERGVVVIGEEDLRKDQCGGGAEEEEIVVLDGAAHEACERRLDRGFGGTAAVGICGCGHWSDSFVHQDVWCDQLRVGRRVEARRQPPQGCGSAGACGQWSGVCGQ